MIAYRPNEKCVPNHQCRRDFVPGYIEEKKQPVPGSRILPVTPEKLLERRRSKQWYKEWSV